MSEDRPILRHNGVGIADMYQPGELEKELRSMTGAEPQNAGFKRVFKMKLKRSFKQASVQMNGSKTGVLRVCLVL